MACCWIQAQPHRLPNGIVWKRTKAPGTVTIPKAGIYQVDVYAAEKQGSAPDSSHLERRTGRILAADGDGGDAWPAGWRGRRSSSTLRSARRYR